MGWDFIDADKYYHSGDCSLLVLPSKPQLFRFMFNGGGRWALFSRRVYRHVGLPTFLVARCQILILQLGHPNLRGPSTGMTWDRDFQRQQRHGRHSPDPRGRLRPVQYPCLSTQP
jgi:hypothetical protein